ncbi:MAG: S-layer homology domain-containing protein [Bacillota bacterium]|nr:S-layer homology domain-containing protein [Bacillota bacterium]
MAVMLSVMVVGAGAAFSDQSKIKNTEAVDACVALNIINGYTDGSYKPEGTITRAEACKMICIALNGGKEPVLGTNATPTFTDIKGHWAEAYIEYCVSLGVVAGVGGGKFDPNGNVTGSQFAKMLLIGLGYNAEHAKFLGNAWEVNVNVVASEKGLYDELSSMDPTKALTRDNAAQMVWNTLQAIEVYYDYTLVSDNGTLTSQVVVKDKTSDKGNEYATLLWTKYNAVVKEGIMVAVKYDDKNDDYNTKVLDVNGDKAFDANQDYSELMGQSVKVMYKEKSDKLDSLYGIYATDKNNTVTAIYGDVKDDNTADSIVEIDSKEYKLASGFQTVATNGELILDSDYTWGGTPYAEVTLIDNDNDDYYEYAVANPFKVGKVSTLTSSKIYISGTNVNSAKLENCNVYDGIAQDDYVVVTESKYAVSVKNEISKAEVVTGKVDGTRANEVRIDGTWYTQAPGAQAPTSASGDAEAIVVNGYYFNLETSKSKTTDVAYVADITLSDWSSNYDGKALIYLPDGTSVTTHYNLKSGSVAKGDLVLYSQKDGFYEIEKATTDNTGFDQAVASQSYYDDEKIGTNRIADDAVVYVKYQDSDSKDAYKVITGKALKAWGDVADNTWAATGFFNKVDGVLYAKALTITASASMPGANGDKAYGIIADSKAWLVEDEINNNDYIHVMINTSGEAKEYKFEDNADNADLGAVAVKGALVQFDVIDGDVINNVSVPSLTEGVITGFTGTAKDDVIYVSKNGEDTNAHALKITDDTKIVYIDAEEAEAQANGNIMKPQATGDAKQYYANVYFINSELDGNASVIFVDYTNSIDGSDSSPKVVTLTSEVKW